MAVYYYICGMKHYITIPCILVINNEEVQQAELLGTKVDEVYALHDVTIFNIDVLEEPFVSTYYGEYKVGCYIYIGNHSYTSTLKEKEIINLFVSK